MKINRNKLNQTKTKTKTETETETATKTIIKINEGHEKRRETFEMSPK